MKAAHDTAQDASFVSRLLAGLVNTAASYPRRVLVAAVLIGAVSAWAAASRLEYRTQRSDLVSPKKEYQQHWQRYVEEFGDDNDLVVVVQGHSRQRMREALEALADRVRRQPDRLGSLFYKVDLRGLHDRALLFLTSEQLEQI
ncbi:MAG TPA: hypothetical protein VFA18_22020, partial [Gemmataceae bacterium]|nr:hypothetical protein [Gemmataceae bacterium]